MQYIVTGDVVVKNLPATAGDTINASLILGWGRLLELEIATLSSILACKIPWSEEPGKLQSMELQRVGHN